MISMTPRCPPMIWIEWVEKRTGSDRKRLTEMAKDRRGMRTDGRGEKKFGG